MLRKALVFEKFSTISSQLSILKITQHRSLLPVIIQLSILILISNKCLVVHCPGFYIRTSLITHLNQSRISSNDRNEKQMLLLSSR